MMIRRLWLILGKRAHEFRRGGGGRIRMLLLSLLRSIHKNGALTTVNNIS